MANPIFSRSDSFQPRAPQGYVDPSIQQGYPGPYAQPGAFRQPGYPQQAPSTEGVVTMDDVIAKTAITMLVLVAAAAATFTLVPDALLNMALIGSAIVGLITVFVVSMRRKVPPAGVLFYAAVEGVFIGAFSKFFESMYPGIVVSAVLATFVAAGATLAAYRFFNIRVTPKFRKVVSIGTFALLGVVLVNFVLALFGVDTGIRGIGSGAGGLSILVSAIAVVLAVLNLVVDFDYVENAIASRQPASESWRAAFGITVTMVWLYTELLRILSYFRR